MKLSLEKVKPFFEKIRILYNKKMFRYFLYAAAGIALLFAGILFEHYGFRRNIFNKPSIPVNSSQNNFSVNGNVIQSYYSARLLIDEKVFVEKISSLFDPKLVYDTYRQGLHTFYLTVFINSSNKVVQHHFKWWDGNSYLQANHFIDSLKFEQVLNTIPFTSNTELNNNYYARIEFQLKIGIGKDAKLVQPLKITEQPGGRYQIQYDKYITRNDIMNKKGIFVDLSEDDISQYTYKNKKGSKPDTPPVPINHQKVFDEKLAYPEMAKEMELEGRVVLRVLVNESGKVAAVRVEKGLGGGCDEAAVKAAFDVLYKPAILNGKPVKSSAVLPVIFKL